MGEINTKFIIQSLKSKDPNKKIYHNYVPDEYKNDKDIIDLERKIGMRTIGQRGYDIIKNEFFVYEDVIEYSDYLCKEVHRIESKWFDNFETYYEYLNGDIYENACYYQLASSKITIDGINKEKLFKQKSFIQDTIDNHGIFPSNDEISMFDVWEKNKRNIKKWIDKFNACDTYEKFNRVVAAYENSVVSIRYRVDIDFFFWNYIFYDLEDKTRFEIIMQYMSSGRYPENKMIRPLCHVYDADKVLELYNYSLGVKQTQDKHKRELRKYIESIKNGIYADNQKMSVYFDRSTHYYCVSQTVYDSIQKVHHYFETIDELIKFRKGDLSNTDLSHVLNLDYDLRDCHITSTTKLPLYKYDDLKYIVKKYYEKRKFIVMQEWYNSYNVILKRTKHEFEFFFDFVSFLKNDLTNSDLLFCDGLQNLNDNSGINFENARLTSSLCDKLKVKYELCSIDDKKIGDYLCIQENEKETEGVLDFCREFDGIKCRLYCLLPKPEKNKDRVFYISDLHLLHRLKNRNVKSLNDIEHAVTSIVRNIMYESGEIILIGGDTSSDYSIFEMFVKTLRKELDYYRRRPVIIYVLGNHELWDFPDMTFDEIVRKYDELLSDNGMYLLQNNILYIEHFDVKVNQISTSDIIKHDEKVLREKVRKARIIFFGGSAFSGYDSVFNADMGIYRQTINRTEEINETTKFEKLYNKISTVLSDKKLIVLTHSPMDCWRKEIEYKKEFIYVSGHTHKNLFYDDGEIRVYADNQIGYKGKNIHMKWFEVDNEYDYFGEYQDGIYSITKDDYQGFYRSKNIMLNFNRENCKIHMLKKKGFYCFIFESSAGALSIMNGGQLKKLGKKDIKYYYDNMDNVVSKIKQPLEEYTEYQKVISAEIQKIGGSGRIHGCIIDIDWFNHIYVNPSDKKITAYWAYNIINKLVYPDIPALLKKECPELYSRYIKLLKDNTKNLPVLSKAGSTDITALPQAYLDTDIYRVSREINKMKKLSSNILTTWYEQDESKIMIDTLKT